MRKWEAVLNVGEGVASCRRGRGEGRGGVGGWGGGGGGGGVS